jgi:hypothetical protein
VAAELVVDELPDEVPDEVPPHAARMLEPPRATDAAAAC